MPDFETILEITKVIVVVICVVTCTIGMLGILGIIIYHETLILQRLGYLINLITRRHPTIIAYKMGRKYRFVIYPYQDTNNKFSGRVQPLGKVCIIPETTHHLMIDVDKNIGILTYYGDNIFREYLFDKSSINWNIKRCK